MKLGTQNRLHLSRRLQAVLVWCLLVCVPLMGMSSALTQLLGARHFHHGATAAVPATSAPQELLAWLRQVPLLAELRGMRERAHAHSHELGVSHSHLARHQHLRGDASVVAVDHMLPDGGAASADTASVPLVALSGGLPMGLLDGLSQAWPSAQHSAFRSAGTARQERPPRA